MASLDSLVTSGAIKAKQGTAKEGNAEVNIVDDEVPLAPPEDEDEDDESQKIEPNPPIWPKSVLIFDPSDDKAAIEKRIFEATGDLQALTGHFSDRRVALLFKPGTYHNVDVQVGYYVQVLGLGVGVGSVRFDGGKGVFCPAADPGGAGSLDTFWRSAENLTTSPTYLTGDEQLVAQNLDDIGVSCGLSAAVVSKAKHDTFRTTPPIHTTTTSIDSTVKTTTAPEKVESKATVPGAEGIDAEGDASQSVRDSSATIPANATTTTTTAATTSTATAAAAGTMMWAVSQAAPIRRIKVEGNLNVFEKTYYASGGFAANIEVQGDTNFGTQQQWIMRNCSFAKKPINGAWNLVFVGAKNAPPSSARTATNDLSVSAIAETPICAEKPFITYLEGKYFLQIPKIRVDTNGVDFSSDGDEYSSFSSVAARFCDVVDFKSQVYVARDTDATDLLQRKLNANKHIVFTPGNYSLTAPLVVKYSNQVLLGIGLATLLAAPVESSYRGGSCIVVRSGLTGVRIAGLMLQAAISQSPDGCLLQWGAAPFDAPPSPPSPPLPPMLTTTTAAIDNQGDSVDNTAPSPTTTPSTTNNSATASNEKKDSVATQDLALSTGSSHPSVKVSPSSKEEEEEEEAQAQEQAEESALESEQTVELGSIITTAPGNEGGEAAAAAASVSGNVDPSDSARSVSDAPETQKGTGERKTGKEAEQSKKKKEEEEEQQQQEDEEDAKEEEEEEEEEEKELGAKAIQTLSAGMSSMFASFAAAATNAATTAASAANEVINIAADSASSAAANVSAVSGVGGGRGADAAAEVPTTGSGLKAKPKPSFVAGVLSDIFVRVGGPDVDRSVSVHTMIRIYEDHVIGDNLWLWRADHAKLEEGEKPREGEKYHLVVPDEYKCDTCLESWGNHTIIYGLAAEHSLSNLVVWHGDYGKCYFYQSELPYGVNTALFADKCGYIVAPNVGVHEGWGLGVYCFFRDFPCLVQTAFKAPVHRWNVKLNNIFIKLLNGNDGILSVLNNTGGQVKSMAFL